MEVLVFHGNSPARQRPNGRGTLSGRACLAPAARWVRPGGHFRGGPARDRAPGGRTAGDGRGAGCPSGRRPPAGKRAWAGVTLIVVLPGRNVCPECPSGEPGAGPAPGSPVRVAARGKTQAQSQVEPAPPPAGPARARRRPAVCRSRVAVAGMRALLGRRPPQCGVDCGVDCGGVVRKTLWCRASHCAAAAGVPQAPGGRSWRTDSNAELLDSAPLPGGITGVTVPGCWRDCVVMGLLIVTPGSA
jgi:hypothetical protein